MRKSGMIITAVAATLALGACSPPGEQESSEPPGSDPTPIEEPNEEQDPAEEAAEDPEAEECTAQDFTVDGEVGQRPEISVPQDCKPPAELLTEDLTEGTGDQAEEGDAVEVHYQLVTFSDGNQVDASWDRDETFLVDPVGNAPLIDGWNEGLIGITEDTRRLLVVPPELGYGQEGSAPDIEPDETLVFVIDAVSVQDSAQ